MKNEPIFLGENFSLKGWKATSIDLKENELIIQLGNRKKAVSHLIFIGVIEFRDQGVIGNVLGELIFEDRGSFKRFIVRTPRKENLFFVNCMEAKHKPTQSKGK